MIARAAGLAALTMACLAAVGPAVAQQPQRGDLSAPAELPVPSLRDMMITTPTPSGVPTAPAEKKAPPEPPVDPSADLAYGAYQRGHYIAAMAEARKRVEGRRLDPAAMTLIGKLYADGLGVARNEAEAARWYERAAALGDREAMFALGLARLEGVGGEKDPKEAADWFEKAGEIGQTEALYNLGVMRLQGDAGRPDYKGAAEAFKAAGDAGQADAQYAYAALLKEGRGVDKNVEESVRWLARAAAQDQIAALVEYGIARFNGSGVEKDEADAARLFERAAERGNAIAQNRLARLYAYGRGVGRDPARAAAWHRLARAQGLSDAWLEGFVQTLSSADQARADELSKRWEARLGPIPAAEAALAGSGPAAPKP